MNRILAQIHTQALNPKTPIHNLFEFMFVHNRQTKRPELMDSIKGLVLDQVFRAIAVKYFRKFPYNLDDQDRTDVIIDALNNTLTAQAIKAFDPKQDFVKYFGHIFGLKLITELKALATRKTRERDNLDDDEFSFEDQMDSRNPGGNTLEDAVVYKDLIKKLEAFIKAKPNGAKIAALLPYLIAGEASGDIAKKLGISAGAVSQWITKLREFILEFAKSTNNDLLIRLITEVGKQRRHDADADAGFLTELFKQYKKRKSSEGQESFSRNPVGELARIQIKAMDDILCDDALVRRAQDSSLSQTQQEKEIDDLIASLQLADDVLDNGHGTLSLIMIK